MARKRPPGAKRRGPTTAKPRDEWSMDPAAVMHRMMNARPLVGCHPEKVFDVVGEIRGFVDEGTWEPKLENFALFYGDEIDGSVLVTSYGLPDDVRGLVVWHLEKHDKWDDWSVWDATEVG